MTTSSSVECTVECTEEARTREVTRVLAPLLPALAPRGPMLFVTAHPRDAVWGASWLLRHDPCGHVLHLTGDAPRNASAPPAGISRASVEALALVGWNPGQLLSLGMPELRASEGLVPLTQCLLAVLKALRPALLIVPPYDGRHPDQDVATFISHAAVALLVRGGRTPPTLLEMRTAPYDFPATPEDRPAVTALLGEEERALKQRMLACYAPLGEAQAPVSALEHYRIAPAYDFTRPPRARGHGEVWCHRAREALEHLRLTETPALEEAR